MDVFAGAFRGGRSTAGLLLLLAGYLTLVVLGLRLGGWVAAGIELDVHHSPETDALWHGLVLVALATYVALMMVPFVPSAEIGLALLVVFGSEIALLVYLGTVLALCLSFLVGRLIPDRALLWTLSALRLRRAHALVARLQSTSGEERLRLLVDTCPASTLTWLLRYRFLAIAIALNLPGNALVGGGGGIALAAGMSRLCGFPAYLLTVCVAAAPVPLFVALTGSRPAWT